MLKLSLSQATDDIVQFTVYATYKRRVIHTNDFVFMAIMSKQNCKDHA